MRAARRPRSRIHARVAFDSGVPANSTKNTLRLLERLLKTAVPFDVQTHRHGYIGMSAGKIGDGPVEPPLLRDNRHVARTRLLAEDVLQGRCFGSIAAVTYVRCERPPVVANSRK